MRTHLTERSEESGARRDERAASKEVSQKSGSARARPGTSDSQVSAAGNRCGRVPALGNARRGRGAGPRCSSRSHCAVSSLAVPVTTAGHKYDQQVGIAECPRSSGPPMGTATAREDPRSCGMDAQRVKTLQGVEPQVRARTPIITAPGVFCAARVGPRASHELRSETTER